MGYVGLVVLMALVGCSSTARFEWKAGAGRYDNLDERELGSLRSARRLEARGELEAAYEQVRELFGSNPESIALGAYLQELEIERALPADEGSEQLDEQDAAESSLEALARRWRELANDDPSVSSLVLAARVERDGPAARVLLERALELDPKCVWGHFGLAHLEARERDWTQAREHLRVALRMEPGHLPTRYLQAATLARSGSTLRAIAAFEHWIDEALGDPRIDPTRLAAAFYDLARLYLESGEVRAARRTLERMPRGAEDELRKNLLWAAVEEAEKNPKEALAAAVAAETLEPTDLVALEQQARIHDEWLRDPIAALAAWERLREVAAEGSDLGSRLSVMRAQIEIERLEALLASSPQPGFGPLEAQP